MGTGWLLWLQLNSSHNCRSTKSPIFTLKSTVKSQPKISKEQKNHIKALYDSVVHLLHKFPDSHLRPGVPRSCCLSSQFLRPQVSSIISVLAKWQSCKTANVSF